MVFWNVPVSAPWIFCPPNKLVHAILVLLLLVRDLVVSSCSDVAGDVADDCSGLLSGVACDVANDCSASVNDGMTKKLGVGIQYICNTINSTNYITKRLAWLFNLLPHGRSGCNFKVVVAEHKLLKFINTPFLFKIALGWIPQNTFDDKSMLVQVMVWCRQATSHYLIQCWRRSLSPCGVTMPQRVK